MDLSLRRSKRLRKNSPGFSTSWSTRNISPLKCKTDANDQHHLFTPPHQGKSEEHKPEEEQRKQDHLFITRSPAKLKGNQNQQLQPQEGELQQEDHSVTPAVLEEHQQLQEEEKETQENIEHFVTLPLAKVEERQKLKPEEEPHKEEKHKLVSLPPAKLKGNQLVQPQEGEPQQEDHHLVTPAVSEEHKQLQDEKEDEPQEVDHHVVTLPLEISEEHQEEDENHPVTLPPGHIVEAEVAGIGGAEVIPIDICSSPEETKPKADPLSLLQPVFKPNYRVKVRQESLKMFMDAAAEIKCALVSHLEELAQLLDIFLMVQSANECFERMRILDVDYQSFHGEISRLIEYYQKLKEVKEATEGNNVKLEAAYKVSVIEADDAKNELNRAENDLLSAQTNINLRRKKIKELKETLGTLEAEDAVERNRLAALTAERDRCHKAQSCSKRKVDTLYSELEGIITQHNATREEIRRSLSRLRGLA